MQLRLSCQQGWQQVTLWPPYGNTHIMLDLTSKQHVKEINVPWTQQHKKRDAERMQLSSKKSFHCRRSRGRCKNSSSKAQQKETKTCLRKSSFSLTHFDDDGHGLLRWFMVVRLEGIFTCSAGHLSLHTCLSWTSTFIKSAFAADDNNLNIFFFSNGQVDQRPFIGNFSLKVGFGNVFWHFQRSSFAR